MDEQKYDLKTGFEAPMRWLRTHRRCGVLLALCAAALAAAYLFIFFQSGARVMDGTFLHTRGTGDSTQYVGGEHTFTRKIEQESISVAYDGQRFTIHFAHGTQEPAAVEDGQTGTVYAVQGGVAVLQADGSAMLPVGALGPGAGEINAADALALARETGQDRRGDTGFALLGLVLWGAVASSILFRQQLFRWARAWSPVEGDTPSEAYQLRTVWLHYSLLLFGFASFLLALLLA